MLTTRKFQLISALLFICLLIGLIIQPVKASPSAQTVPTAGPSPTKQASSTPEDNSNPPPPTAVLATSALGGIQPSATATPTLTPTVTVTATNSTADTTTPQPTFTQTAVPTDHPVATQVAQVTQEVLPTLPTVVASAQVSQAGAWCYPIGALILAVLIVTVVRRLSSSPKVS